MRSLGRKRHSIIMSTSMLWSNPVGLLLAVVGVVRHRADQMITILYEAYFVVRSRLGGDTHRHQGAEAGTAAQPRMRNAAG
ncbi:hypothetical protein [Streptomyces sp. NPDC003480]